MDTIKLENHNLKNSLNIIYKSESQNNIGNINSWIRLTQSRWIGLSSLNILLNSCHANVIVDYGIQWIKITSEISIMTHESNVIRLIAAENFSKLIEYSSQIPEVAREVSGSLVANLLQVYLSTSVNVLESTLQCLIAILKFFPGPCGPFKGKICKFTVPSIFELNSEIRDNAINCWCYVPIVGGGGTKRKNHMVQWQDQLKEVLESLTHTKVILFDDDEEMIDPSISNLSLKLPPLPVNEPLLSLTLIQRFVGLSKCAEKLLKLDFKLPVEINVQKIIEFLFSCFDVSPKSMGLTSEKRTRASFLKTIHGSCLTLLQSLISSCGQYVCRHNSSFCRMFDNLLHLWKDLNPTIGKDNKHVEIRVLIYETIIHWIQNCGSHTKFLCGKNHTVTSLLQHLVEDIKPIPDHLKIAENTLNISNNNKKNWNKKNKSMNILSENSGVRIIKNNANSKLSSFSLQVLRSTIFTFGSHLSVNVHKTLQENVIILLLKLKQGISIIPYASCESSRKELYHLLFALTSNPSVVWPSPLQFATQLLKHGAHNDVSLRVKAFCVEASVTVANIVHPRAPSMQRVAKNFAEDCKNKWLLDHEDQVNFYSDMRNRNLDNIYIKETVNNKLDVLNISQETVEICGAENSAENLKFEDGNISAEKQGYISQKEINVNLTRENVEHLTFENDDKSTDGYISQKNNGNNLTGDDDCEYSKNKIEKCSVEKTSEIELCSASNMNPTIILTKLSPKEIISGSNCDSNNMTRCLKRKVEETCEEVVDKIVKTGCIDEVVVDEDKVGEDLETMLRDFDDSTSDCS